MTWEIVVGILTLLASAITICTVVSNNTKAVTEIKCSVDALNKTVGTLGASLKNLEKQTNNHEVRITVLERSEVNDR